MPERYGQNTRFKSATDINHSRTQEPASGIPRNPGRPQGRGDAMPRNRQKNKKNERGIPSWAIYLLRGEQPPQGAQGQPGQQPGHPSAPPQQQPRQQPRQQPMQQPMQQQPQQQQPAQQQSQPQQPTDQLALRKRLAMLMGGGRR